MIHGLFGGQELRQGCAVEGRREAAGDIETVEELEERRHLGMHGKHARQKRRAAATGPDHEAIHACSSFAGCAATGISG